MKRFAYKPYICHLILMTAKCHYSSAYMHCCDATAISFCKACPRKAKEDLCNTILRHLPSTYNSRLEWCLALGVMSTSKHCWTSTAQVLTHGTATGSRICCS